MILLSLNRERDESPIVAEALGQGPVSPFFKTPLTMNWHPFSKTLEQSNRRILCLDSKINRPLTIGFIFQGIFDPNQEGKKIQNTTIKIEAIGKESVWHLQAKATKTATTEEREKEAGGRLPNNISRQVG
ncbi:hypothetical protein TNCV_2540971 [Trichonephila clavipes]|nr:hypothetical protein TNCV_2540971 [Trichonephila clavipes]